MSGFTVRAGREPDEIDLELASMRGALGPASPELEEARASIEESRAAFAEVRRPLPVPRRAWRWGAAVVAMAAGLAVVALAWPTGTGVHPMGGLPVDLAVRHDGATVSAPSAYSAGDELFVRFRAPADGVVEVWTVQDDGAVSILEPGRPVRAGQIWALDGAARLDDHVGREWLVVSLADEARDPAAIEAEAASLLPDPARASGPRRFVAEVTRSR